MLPFILTVLLCATAVVFATASLFMSAYTRWVYDVKIPAVRARRDVPPAPFTVRVGARLAKVDL